MERAKTFRNVAIVVAIAAAVYFIPGGEPAAATFERALWAVFGLAAGYLGLRIYRENRVALHALGDRHRALLYGGVGLIVFEIAARPRMWSTGLGELAWFVLAAFALWALLEVFRHSRSY
jgi:hypothetical protein